MFSFLSQSPCSLSPAPLTSTIFITANVLLAGGQLLPHSSTSLGLLVRLLLTLSHLTFSAWSLTILCSGPAFCWHSLLSLHRGLPAPGGQQGGLPAPVKRLPAGA